MKSENRNRKYLEGALVIVGIIAIFAIAAVMFLSASVVAADTPKIQLGPSTGNTIESSFSTLDLDTIWDNGYPNLVSGICCQRIGSVGWSDIADDFHTDQEWTITGAQWDTTDDATYTWEGFDDMYIYEYTANGPGAMIVQLEDVPNTREYMGEVWGRQWYRYTIDLEAAGLEFDLPAGDYFILLRPYTPYTSGQSFWMTSDGNPASQSEGYLRSDYFGYPDWTPMSQVFGEYYDFSFRLFGKEPAAPVPVITPIGLIALVGLLSVIAAVSIRTNIRKKR